MLILRSSVQWRAPGKHFPLLTKASHAVDIPVKNTLSVQEKYPALNRVPQRVQVEHVEQI
jgi:hypothetical protein